MPAPITKKEMDQKEIKTKKTREEKKRLMKAGKTKRRAPVVITGVVR